MAKRNAEYAADEGGKASEAGMGLGRVPQQAARAEQPGAEPPGRARRRKGLWSRGIGGLFGGARPREVFSFCNALALLLECGIPLVKALTILANRIDNLALARAASDMARAVEEGRSFSAAAAQYGQFFPGPLLSMLRAGEQSGKLGDMLNSIAERGERLIVARRKLVTMLIYPALVVVVAILVVAVVFGVLAKGFGFFAEMDVKIPWSMQTLLKIGTWLRSGTFWAVAAIVIIGLPIAYAVATRFLVFRLLRDRFLIRFPGIRHFVKEDLLANFGRVFSTMLHSGLPVQESLQAAHDTCRNEVGRLTLERAQEAVRRGQRITPTLEQADIFPVLAYDLCAAGEEAGALDRVFSKLGDYYEEKLAGEAAMLGRLVQPAIVLLLALIVGFIVFSFFSMYTSALMQLQASASGV